MKLFLDFDTRCILLMLTIYKVSDTTHRPHRYCMVGHAEYISMAYLYPIHTA